jgi:hypothetical protein
MLSHAVMRDVQVFPSFVMLSLACVFVRGGLPSVEMWFGPGKDWCCGLSKVETVKTVGFHQVIWLIMLKSTKDRILGVDTTGQHESLRVRYGTTCLLIRYAIGCVSCSVEWDGSYLCDPSVWHSMWTAWTTWCKRGHCVRETSAPQAGPLCVENCSKDDILL